ncbi:hypothetical protein [Nitrosomonas ureae]|uniref:hypothetical protein n=1 Tax=Nitrosomonas ureae TaxID=44577 RepID=UPI001E447E2F|nr:hypothetical protein [Nitrosomonas ureae]
MRPLHGVMSGTRIRQKFAKKRSLHGVNEHFSRIFNAIIVPRSNRAKASQYEWSKYCANPKLKTNRANAVKKPYKLEKKAFELYYSASLHVEKPKRPIPKMVYAAIFLFFAVPAMAIITYGRITDRLADPMQEIRGKNQQINTGGRNTAFKRNSGHSLPSRSQCYLTPSTGRRLQRAFQANQIASATAIKRNE